MTRCVPVGLLAILLSLTATVASATGAPGHGRAWELVSTLEPGGPRVLGTAAWDFAGEHLVYRTIGPSPGSEGGEVLFQNLATRGPGGWAGEPVSVRFTVPEAQLLGTLGLAVDTDFSDWLWGSIDPLVPGGPTAPEMGVYRRSASGAVELLAGVGEFELFAYVQLETASADLRHAGFNSDQHLLPADSGRIAGRDAYEITDAGLGLVGVDEAGDPLSACGSVWGSGVQRQGTNQRAMSLDGNRAFVTSPDPGTSACPEPAQVYLREAGAETTRISASRCSRPDCGPAAAARFAGADRDGGRAYFVSAQQLLDEDIDEAADLYRYDVAADSLQRLSGGAGPEGARVLTAAVPAAGGRVYFTARGLFVPGQGVEGGENLYLSEGGTIRYVATVPGLDLASAVLSADGSVIAFATPTALVPGDTDAMADIYRYDVGDNSLRDVSLAGERGNGPFPAQLPESEEPQPRQRPGYLSDNGGYLFFQTREQLLPEDVNDETDVYEWADGSLGLVSSGTGVEVENALAGASGDGRTAYFLTRQSLLPQDGDGGEPDVYAARIGGGFPSVQPPPECVGEACRGPAVGGAARPILPTERKPRPGGRPADRGRFSIAAFDPGERRRLAAGEVAELALQVPDAGRVSVLAEATLNGLTTAVARDRAVAWRPGRVRLHLRLSAPALRSLAARGRLHLRLVARYSGQRRPLRRELLLREAS